jgi:hypothetical protein
MSPQQLRQKPQKPLGLEHPIPVPKTRQRPPYWLGVFFCRSSKRPSIAATASPTPSWTLGIDLKDLSL